MLLRFIAVSLVMMGCATEVLGAKFNCTATQANINDCLKKPENKNTWKDFSGQMEIFNMSAVTSILKKLKTDGCIKKSTLKDIQAWVKIQTPPKSFSAIYKSLTEEQKTIIVNSIGLDHAPDNVEELSAVYDIVYIKIANQSNADKKKKVEWSRKINDACKGAVPW